MNTTRSMIRSGVALALVVAATGCSGAGDAEQLAVSRDSDAGAEPLGRVSQALTEVTDKFFADETGTIYATTTDGDLLWFKDLARNGTSSWHANSGNR